MRDLQLRLGLPLALLAAALVAGPVAAQDEAGGPWTWRALAELGYRDPDVSGSEDLYRSVVDRDEGLSLFGLELSASKGAERGAFADRLQVRASGFGGEPAGDFRLDFGRRGTYDFALRFSRIDDVFAVPSWQLGQHGADRERELFDVSLRVHPTRRTKAWLAYSTRSLDGPGQSTQMQGSNQFLLDELRDRDSEEIRFGVETGAGPATIALEHSVVRTDGRSDFKLAEGAADGNQGSSTLDHLNRTTRTDGRTETSWISFQLPFRDRAEVSGRLTYSSGDVGSEASRDLLQTSPGPPTGIQRLLTADGNVERNVREAELGFTVRVGKGVSIIDSYRRREARLRGDVDTVTTTVINGNPVVRESAAVESYDEDSFENELALVVDLPHGVLVRGGLRHGEREVKWQEEGEDRQRATHADQRLFGALSWRASERMFIQAEAELGDQNRNEDDPEILFRRAPLKSKALTTRLRYRPDQNTTLTASLRYSHRQNGDADAWHEDAFSLAVGGSRRWGERLRLDGTLTRSRQSVASTLDITEDGERIQKGQDYLLSATTFTLTADWRLQDRIHLRLTGTHTRVTGSYPTRFYRVEPSLVFRVADELELRAGWFVDSYERGGDLDPSEDFQAEGVVASLAWRH